MQKKNPKGLYYAAAVCFLMAGLLSENMVYYLLALCMLALGWINRSK